MTEELTLAPLYPITKVNYIPLRFTATYTGSSPSSLIWRWEITNGTWEHRKEPFVGSSSLTFDLPPLALGDYKLSVSVESGDLPRRTAETKIVVMPASYDNKNTFISYGADGNYYLVVLTPDGGAPSLIRPLPGLPDGFKSSNIGSTAPLATSVAQTPGAAFITCVLLNLQSSENIQARLARRGK